VRLHPGFGTLEVRVCDQPATAAESAALAAVVQALCRHLAEGCDAGPLPPPASRERIEENRWRALRHGPDGSLLDPLTGRASGTRTQVAQLLTTLEPHAEQLGSSAALAAAWELLERTGSQRQRAWAQESRGLRGVVDRLAGAFEREVEHEPPAAGPR
jgi:carboxylate-amine ligase